MGRPIRRRRGVVSATHLTQRVVGRMNTLRFLLLYCWLKLQLLKQRKVRQRVSLSRKDYEAAGLITTKLKELPKFSTMSDGEKNAFLLVGLVIGLALFQSISKRSGSKSQSELPPFVE